MTAKVTLTVHELSSNPVRVSGAGDDVVLQPTQSRDFDGQTITLKEEVTDPNATQNPAIDEQDVWNHQNPNGITRAEIAPKLPKAGGETEQRLLDDGRVLETTIQQDPALAVAGGGPKGAESGKTPGPDVTTQGVELSGGSMGARPTGSQSAPQNKDEDDDDDKSPSSRGTTTRPSSGSASSKK